MTVDEALRAYVETLNENFPLFMMMRMMSEEKLIQIMENSLKSGRKYSVRDPDKNRMYRFLLT